MTRILTLADPDALDRAADELSRGALVVIPTETVYGLAALASDRDAVAALFAAKGRDDRKAIAVLVADYDQAQTLIAPPAPARLARLAAAHWPGPLTVVVRRHRDVGLALGGDEATIGIRCPAHDFVRALARRVGPLATTSANRSGEPTPPDAAAAAGQLGEWVGLVIDGGELTGVPSTVLDLTVDPPKVLRQGPIDAVD